MKRVYISGGMTGYSTQDIDKRFGKAEKHLKGVGMKTFNPARWRWFLRFLPYKAALAFDIFMMTFCDAIYMLDGWNTSDGSVAEHRFACSTGMIIMFEK